GAEEDDLPPSSTPPAHLAALSSAWARALDVADGEGFGTTGLVAWLNTPRAARVAAAQGLPLWGPDPVVVREVHDKGFCARAVERLGLLEAPLRGAITVFDVEDTTVDNLIAATVRQPTWMARAGMVAKSRMSTSGRGRLDLRRGITERAAAKLRRRGGVVVEPWLDRVADYSSQWWIDDVGAVRFVGATRATQSFAGLWSGARMWLDDDGIPGIPGAVGRDVVDRGQLIVREAAIAGLRGPCGVDVFTWTDVDGTVYTRVCELNARMTGGLVAVLLARGLVRASGLGAGAQLAYSDGEIRAVSTGAVAA
ncbi:MAG TPA: hypothetical protein VGF99_18090, partial [Myxococcota bacterium]